MTAEKKALGEVHIHDPTTVVPEHLCREMINWMSQTHALRRYADTAKAQAQLEEALQKSAVNAGRFESVYHDYLAGVASAMNPLPQQDAPFERNDGKALYSDWTIAFRDLSRVFEVVSKLRKQLEALDAKSAGRPAPKSGPK